MSLNKKSIVFKLSLLPAFFILGLVASQAQPLNDNPCSATPLTVGTACNYVNSTNLNATASVGVPAPGCANYLGGDVWFSAVVPTSGSIIFDSNTGGVTDGGMALYTGTCGALTLVACDDDGSANGLMPSISATGLTPGTTVYIRFWEYGNDNNGTFSICAKTLNCNSVNNASCTNADPFCTGVSYDYCNTTNVPSLGGGGPYGCCLSTPNPAFYYMNVASNGQIVFNISQQTNAGVPIDVDFVCWGPFASQASMCSGYSAANIVDCSYSIAAIETATIPSAVAGQWYLILITNFSNQAGVINFNQTNSGQAGSGSTNCNLLTAIPSACTGGVYTLNGNVQVQAPPATGTLTVSTSCGGSQVINAPFSTSIPYSIPNICGNGQTCSVSAVFSATGSPAILPGSYTAPSCNTLTATPGACVNGQYTLVGTLTTACLPSSGTLTISNSCGGSIVVNAPFTSPYNWTLPPSNGNGGNCTVTAVYSAAGAPIIPPFNFTEPSCCGSSTGTIAITTTNGSQTVLPNGTTQVVLCPGGSFQLISNNNYTLPPAGCANCIPELMYAIYTSPGPTVPDPDLDPNWTGYYWTGQDITTANAAPYNTNTTGGCSSLLSLPAVTGYANPNSGNNTLVIVPITADDGDNEVPSSTSLSHDQNNDGCFDIGDPISVTFLNPISFNPTVSCNGSVTIEISGGYPQFFNGVYTVTNTGSGTLSSTSAVSGGNVTISALSPGQTYSISVNGGSGCASVSYSGVYSGPPVVNIAPNPATVCQGGCVTLGATVTSGVSAGNRTFNSNHCSSIPDAGISSIAGSPGTLGGNWSSNSINVNGVCDNTWNTGDPLTICLNIDHTYLSDLSIYIQAPNGVFYLLCDDVGGTGNNFAGTCFSAVAASVIPAPAVNAPYSGSYRPEGAGNNFGALNGSAINGTWTLWVGDQFAGDAGTLSSWSITLGNQNTFTYNWSPATGLSATNILNPTACPTSSTTYTLTVTNSCGCSTTTTVPVTVLPPVTPTFNPIGPICSGSTAPTLPGTSINGINGTWSPNVISNTTSATYTFTPAAGQCATSATLNVAVSSGLNLSTVTNNPLCFGGTNGSINVSATGGASPLTYVWSGSASTTSTASGLSAGTYTVTVTDANGCTGITNASLTSPAQLTSTSTTGNILCNGGTTTATVTPSGGSTPYTYAWSPSGGTGATSTALTAGSYSCTITDANGCTTVRNVTLTQPSALSATSTQGTIACNGGTATATVTPSGGTTPYSYAWSPSGGTGATSTALTAGSYSCTITDANGCTTVRNITLTQPSALSATSTQGTIACNGGTATATVTPIGGTTTYTYAWSPSGGTGATSTALTVGSYSCTITDANGCTTVRNITLTQPSALSATSTQGTIACNGGTATASVTPSGGTTPYTYAWSPSGGTGATSTALTAGSYSCTITDANGCTTVRNVTLTQPSALSATSTQGTIACNGGTATATVTPSGGSTPYSYAWSPNGGTGATSTALTAGSYSCTITDANGCTTVRNITLTQPSALSATSTQGTIACNSGTATASVTPSGGTTPYTYVWSPSGGTGATSTALTAGSYSCTITDANGCTTVRNIILTQPSALSATSTQGTIACNGGTATATVTPSGGTTPYSYAWSPSGGTGATSTALTAGSYSCIITDANGCTTVRNVTLTQPSALSATSTQGNILCNGGATTATITPNGGTSPYTYTWSPSGGATATSNALTAGSYTCTITDANGCTVMRNIIITQPALISTTTSSVPASCNNSNGSASVVASGGTGPFGFAWSPSGGNGSTATGLGSGNYAVIVTDANGCTATANVVIASSSSPLASVSAISNVSCNGGSNGSVSLSVSGGASPYTYAWSPSVSATSSASGLPAGNYSVIVSGSNGCTTTINIAITQPLALSAVSTSGAISCNGGNTTATVTANGGTLPYTYVWSPIGGTSATSTALNAGIYTCTITDANGCTTVRNITLTQPSALSATNTQGNILCNGGTATASVTPSGGTTPYTYAWSPSGGTGATSTAITAGSYSCTITDANGCTTARNITLTQPSALSATSTQGAIACNGGTATATITPSGGTTPYTYAWSPSGGTGATSTALTAGSYTCTITDANGCTTVRNINLTQPSALSATSTQGAIACNGGTSTATVTPNGGTAPYTYAWTPIGGTGATSNSLSAGSYTCTISDANGCTAIRNITLTQPGLLSASASAVSATCNTANGSASVVASGGTAPFSYLWSPSGGSGAIASGLNAGIYTVVVTDANGCSTSSSAIVNSSGSPQANVSSVTNVSCNGGNNGSASLAVTGGVLPYGYVWSPAVSTTSSANNLASGNYTVIISGSDGCTSTVNINITQPTVLSATSTQGSISCNGGTATATVTPSGGTTPYTYAWSPSGGTGATSTALTAGSYSCIITDANGCTMARNITLTQPSALSATSTQGTIACNGGTATASVTPSGGTTPYTYAWSPSGATGATSTALTAGSYSCTITDANGCTTVRNVTLTQPSALSATSTQGTIACNGGTATATVTPSGGTTPYTYAWSPSGGTGATSTALTAGSYSCTITDANGCTTVRNITLTQPSALSATSTQGSILCNGGTTTSTITPSGGTSPYTFAWSPSGGAGATSNALAAGIYSCTVTDANGCTAVRNITLTQPSVLSATSVQGSIACNGGTTTATITPNGGTSPYTYTWSLSGGTAATSNSLSAGSYTCTVTDANGCTTVRSVTLTQPSLLTVSVTSIASSCGLSNGSASATASGGTVPYAYSWNPSAAATSTATGLIPGAYSVTIIDANGCTASASTVVGNVGAPSLTVTGSNNVTCAGGSNGSAAVSASGGIAPYTYSWSPSGGNGSTANGLVAGIYQVTVTGSNGCTVSTSVSISQPAPIAVSFNATAVSCFGGNNGSASVSVSGGSSPYSYLWSGGAGANATANNLTAGNYTCVITDAQGCTSNIVVVVSQPTVLSLTVNTTDLLCFGDNTGTATAIANGGTSSYQYAWTGITSSNAAVSGLSAQVYSCTVTDGNGCSQTQSFTIGQPAPLQNSLVVVDAHCGQSDGSITLNTSGGVQPYAYAWSTSGSGSTLLNIAAGVYQVTITDFNGCTISSAATIVDLPGVVASLGGSSNVSCYGGFDGTASISAVGGVLPYVYSWSPNIGSTANVNGLSAGNYQVTLTDVNGCTSVVSVNITEPAQLIVNATASANVICPGTSSNLTAIASGGVATYNYVWSPGNLIGSVQTVVPLASTNYSVLVTDANGCTQVAPVNVIVSPFPQAGVSVDATSGCAPVCVQFTDGSSVSAPGLINSWSWNFGDGTTSTIQNPSHCFDDPGSYDITLTVTTSDGCVSTWNANDYIHANGVPVASFGYSPASPEAYYPEVSFLNNSVGASSWLWNFGDLIGTTSTSENPVFLFPDTSCFTVTLIAISDSGCVDTTHEIVCIKPVVTVYVPNAFTPNGDGVNDVFYPVCTGLVSGNYSFWIYDRWGQSVFFADKPLVGWDGKYADSRQDAQMDAYVWRLICKDFDGRIVTKSGRVTLVR